MYSWFEYRLVYNIRIY